MKDPDPLFYCRTGCGKLASASDPFCPQHDETDLTIIDRAKAIIEGEEDGKFVASHAELYNLVADIARSADQTPGSLLAYSERRRQIEVEGYTAVEDDANYTDSDPDLSEPDLIDAAISYAGEVSEKMRGAAFLDRVPVRWPWKARHYKRASPMRMLVKAAALLIAEIDRRWRTGERP